MTHSTNTPPSNNGSVAIINAKMFSAAAFGAVGVWLWPDTVENWGWGFLAITLWFSAFCQFVEVIKLSFKIYLRDRTLTKFTSQGREPKSAELASSDALQEAGMIDG